MINIALIEDDSIMASAVKLQLRVILDMVYNINSFNNMSAAIKYLTENHCDLIISDLNLPDSKGNATMKLLNYLSDDSQVIFMSGTADDLDSINQNKHPNAYFIMKDMAFNESMLNVLSRKLKLKSV